MCSKGAILSKYLIVGIDPGATVGVAMLGLDGGIVALRSTREGIGDAVRIIEKFGTPSLVACDATPSPQGAQKAASLFSCLLFVPSHNMREQDKGLLSRGTGVANAHERDAYCAALVAWRAYQNKLRQIDALEDIPEAQRERLKHLLLKGYKLTDAIMELGKQPPSPPASSAPAPENPEGVFPQSYPPPHASSPHRHAAGKPFQSASFSGHAGAKSPQFPPLPSQQQLQMRVAFLARENSNLRMALQKLEGERDSLAHKIRLLENGVRSQLLSDNEVRKLRQQLMAALQRLGKFSKGGKKPQAKAALPQKPPPAQKSAVLPSKRPAQNEDARQHAPAQEGRADLNEEAHNIDLEKLLAEYRGGRRK